MPYEVFFVAGEEGLEPSLPEPESGVLPLDDSPPERLIIDAEQSFDVALIDD